MEIKKMMNVEASEVLRRFEGNYLGYNDFEIDIEEVEGNRLDILLEALKQIFNYKKYEILRDGNINNKTTSIELLIDNKAHIYAINVFDEKLRVRVYEAE